MAIRSDGPLLKTTRRMRQTIIALHLAEQAALRMLKNKDPLSCMATASLKLRRLVMSN